MLDVFWDESKKYSTLSISTDGLTVGGTDTQYKGVSANIGKKEGKWYWEVVQNSGVRVDATVIGVALSTASLGGGTNITYATQHKMYSGGAKKHTGGTAYGATYTYNDIISVLLDMDIGTIEFWKNGISQGVAYNDLLTFGEVYPHVAIYSTGEITANFGKSEFVYNIPHGFKSYSDNSVRKNLFSKDNKAYSLKSEEVLKSPMTSNTTPAPYVASSSANNTVTIFPYMAFDKSPETYWASATIVAPASPRIQIDFGSSKKVSHLVITARNGSTSSIMASSPKDFYVEGSNDNVTFTKVLEVKDEIDWKPLEKRVFALDKTVNYRHYRMFTTATNGINYLSIGELEYKNIELTEIPDASLANLIKYGTSDMKDFGYVLQNKSYVLQDGKSEDADGLRKQELSIKPLSIKFE